MQKIEQVQKSGLGKVEQLQKVCDAKGYGLLGLAGAGVTMLFVFCPMSIVAVAAPYWTFSTEVHGNSVSAEASLWTVSSSTEIGGKVTEVSMALCGDEMPGFEECGKVGAVRFFVIAALLLSFGAAIAMLVAFSSALSTTALRRKTTIAGLGGACGALLSIFFGICVVGSIEMQDGYKLNGAGFAFLVLELFFVMMAIGGVVYVLRRSASQVATDADGSQPQPAPDALGAQAQAPAHPPAAKESSPTLLTTSAEAQKADLEEGAKTNDVITSEV